MSDSTELGGGFAEFTWDKRRLEWELSFDWVGQDVTVRGKSKSKTRAINTAIGAMEDLRLLIGCAIDDLEDMGTEVEE